MSLVLFSHFSKRSADTWPLEQVPRWLTLHDSLCRHVIEHFTAFLNVIGIEAAQLNHRRPTPPLHRFHITASWAVGQFVQALKADGKFLTPEEVSGRYRGGISIGTFRKWRAMRIAPTFVKFGKAALYPVTELDVWDQKI
jgi:hypothetical protein